MTDEVHVAGTRSFAAEVVEFARDAGLRVAGLLEPVDAARVGSEIHGLPVRALESVSPAGRAIVGTGKTERREIVARLERAGWQITGVVHPRAHVAATASLGVGVIVGPGVVIGAATQIGDHVMIGRGALVGHHTHIAPFATLGPGANVAGNVTIEEDAHLAMACAVREHITIGRRAQIAMGAVVVGDAPAGAQLRGVPARPITADARRPGTT